MHPESSSADEVATVDTRAWLERLMEQPQAPFLIAPGSLPTSAASYGAALKASKSALAIAMRPVDVSAREPWFIWFAFDPPIDAGQTHGYIARCKTYVEVWIQAVAGTSTVTLWRVPLPQNPTSKSATAPNVTTKMSRSSTPARLFDTKVVGNANSSNYSIFGGWKQGRGGTCPA